MPISTRYLVQTTSAFLLIAFLVLVGVVGMNFWLAQKAQSNYEAANVERDTRIAAVELRNALQVAESSQRGYIITGNEIYLGPYQSAKVQANRRLAVLQQSLRAEPNSGPKLQRLSDILNAKFDELDRTIDLKRNQHDDEVLALIRTNAGKNLTDEANVFFAGIIGQTDERLTAGAADQRANTAWLRLLTAIAALVIITVISGAVVVVARYTKELGQTHSQLNTLNIELEQRVARRTSDLAKSRDRFEVLLSEVNHRVANSLALVSGLVSLQIKALDDTASKEALAETQERIFAISLVHRRLYENATVISVALNEYLTGLLEHLGTSLHGKHDRVVLKFDIEPIALETDLSINLGVILTELVTNAFKYAYPKGLGEIRVSLRALPEEVAELAVEDDGIGRAEGKPAKGTGVGTKIVNAMCLSLGANIQYLNLKPGTRAQLNFSTKPRRSAINEQGLPA